MKNIIVEYKGGGKHSLYTVINGHLSNPDCFEYKIYIGVYQSILYVDAYNYLGENDLKYHSSYAVCSKDVTLDDVKFAIEYIKRMFKIDYLLDN